MHDVIGKRKTVLDQFISGLKMLDFHKEMKRYPALFECLFVYSRDGELNSEKVLNVLLFKEDEDNNTQKFLKHYLTKSTPDKLEMFLKYTTGSPRLPAFGLGKIRVTIDNIFMGITGKTCSNVIEMAQFDNQDMFNVSMDSVLNECNSPTKKISKFPSFNCI